MKYIYAIICVFILLGTSCPLYSINLYVSPSGNDKNDGKSIEKPFKTIQKAADESYAGDTVFIQEGVYEPGNRDLLLLRITNSGEEGFPIVFCAYPGHTPVLYGSTSPRLWKIIQIDASYIELNGLEVKGRSQSLSLSDAEKYYEDAVAGTADWNTIGQYNTNGISIGGKDADATYPHHVVIRNCVVHDIPGGGIGSMLSDYLTIENNTVYNCSWYNMYACSGISVLHPYDYDDYDGYKIIISGNYCYNNKTLVKWFQSKDYSDGNGIIIDRNVANKESGFEQYTSGRTLICNNVCFNNGGSGCHAFDAHRVDIINNTAYHNGTETRYANGSKTGWGNIFINYCSDAHIYNNIMYARDGGQCNQGSNKSTKYEYRNNLYWNGSIAERGSEEIKKDPQFVNLSTDPTIADFHLKSMSPAIGTGADNDMGLPVDFDGVSRPRGRVDIGAYQYNLMSGFHNPIKDTTVKLNTNCVRDVIELTSKDIREGTKIEVRICGMGGQLVYSGYDCFENNLMLVPATSLTSGIYVIMLREGGKKIAEAKFVRI